MSHATDAAIGMMDGAYFTSRNDILNFINSLLDLNLTKIEQTASGAAACQLTEYMFPGSIPMSRVNWAAKSSHEFVGNYKLLQSAFSKNKIQKYVDVDKLIRAKYQDNLEFCQWLKAFFDQTTTMMRREREGYDPVAVRAKGKGGKAVASSKGGTKRVSANARSLGRNSATVRSTSSISGGSLSTASKENTANLRGLPAASGQSRKVGAGSSSFASSAKIEKLEEEKRVLKLEHASLTCKYSELEHASAEVEVTLQTVESERNFYFEKLRGIELMLQVYKEKEEENEGTGDVIKVMDNIFKVMYAAIDNPVEVDDEGNLVGELGDITASSLDKSAFDEDLVQAEEEEEELLTSGIENIAPENNAFSSDLSDLDDKPLIEAEETDGNFAVVNNDEDSSDEDLLSD